MSDDTKVLRWGEDLERDCKELKRLESFGLYPAGYHNINCPIDHTRQETKHG